MTGDWRKFDGYHETHQLVNDLEQIIGEVHGSAFEKSAGWTAWDRRGLPNVWLGLFVSREAAIAAVERAMGLEVAGER